MLVKRSKWFVVSVFVIAALGCSDDDIDSDTEARWAYLGFDAAIDRAIGLGFDGFNAASSANIPEQTYTGPIGETMIVGGQVDQGSSDNKEMRLLVTLTDYTDGPVDDSDSDTEDIELTYDSGDNLPLALDLSLKDIPTGTFTGTMAGTLLVSGDLDAEAIYNLSISGGLTEGANGDVLREAGSVNVTGTVESGGGEYTVNTTL